ncbi:hypothetical protein ACFQH2_15625 [Natronoarchaeum sp. GCM10025703]|uniref:DUF7123 family protein n=1 Tax=unclassified Natronoarchaeum TaxID=2620183 RepID=UPI00361AB7AF
MSTTAATTATEDALELDLSEKQRRILEHLREKVATKTYFKSRNIGDALDMTAKEVGANMTAIQEGAVGINVEKWGYSSSTTWKVTA